jgi:hypothetical protein
VTSSACSLILATNDLDQGYGQGGGGATTTNGSSTPSASTGASIGSVGSGASGGSAGNGGSDAGFDGGGDAGDGGCATACAYGCGVGGLCNTRTLDSTNKTNAIACDTSWVYAVGNGTGLMQYAQKATTKCQCLAANDPALGTRGIEVAVGGGSVVWRTYDTITRFWVLDDVDCCAMGPRSSRELPLNNPSSTSSPDFADGIATDGTYVYWLGGTGILKAPLAPDAGGTVTTVAAFGGTPEPSGLALTGQELLLNLGATSNVYEVSTADGGAQKSWGDSPVFTNGRGIHTDGQIAVWAVIGPNGDYDAGQIHGFEFQQPTASPALLATYVMPSGVATDAHGYVYVTDSKLGTLTRFPFANPTQIEPLWQAQGTSPMTPCTDGTFVYWIFNAGILQVDQAPPGG